MIGYRKEYYQQRPVAGGCSAHGSFCRRVSPSSGPRGQLVPASGAGAFLGAAMSGADGHISRALTIAVT